MIPLIGLGMRGCGQSFQNALDADSLHGSIIMNGQG